jgi:hypothetical protein
MNASSGDINARTNLPNEEPSTAPWGAQQALKDEHEIPRIHIGELTTNTDASFFDVPYELIGIRSIGVGG